MADLIVDPDRDAHRVDHATGIYVRAKLGEQWGSFDIATLTRESVIAWLASRDAAGEPALAFRDSVVLALLGWAE